MAKIFRRMIIDKKTGKRKPTKSWWISYTQHGRQERRSPGVTDQKSDEMLPLQQQEQIKSWMFRSADLKRLKKKAKKTRNKPPATLQSGGFL